MNRRIYLLIIAIALLFTTLGNAQESEAPAKSSVGSNKQSSNDDTSGSTERDGKPEWVEYLDSGRPGLIAGSDYYFGAARSEASQSDADDLARLEFARMVETRVTNTIEETVKVRGGQERYSMDFSSEITTELSVKGISMSERFVDSDADAYYSLIMVTREEYVEIIEKNVEEELALRDAEFRKKQDEERLALEQERSDQEREAEEARMAIDERERREELRQRQLEAMIRRYREFLDTQPQSQLVSIRTAQLGHKPQHYSLSIGISPGITPFQPSNLVYRAHIAYRLFNFFEISTTVALNDNSDAFDWWFQEFDLKMRILDNVGELIPVSLAVGGKGLFFQPYNVFTGEKVEIVGVLYGAFMISFPMALHTHLALYGGNDRVSLGFISHPFFTWLDDAIGFIGEASYTFHPLLTGDTYLSNFLFQAGFRLKTFDNLLTTITFEDHNTFSFVLDLFF